MFTGLVQALGTLQPLTGNRLQISIVTDSSPLMLADLAIGDSVAVDGVCLTVVEILSQGFLAAVSPETLHRTTLGTEHGGHRTVNLETSLRVGSKLGGHFVTGHIDGIGCLQTSAQKANSWEMQFSAPEGLQSLWSHQIAPYIVPKGSVAINGISLTVADCDPVGNWFTVAAIPHTFQETNLKVLKPGSWVNVEGDILGKYVEKLLRTGRLGPAVGRDRNEANNAPELPIPTHLWPEQITPDFLSEHGYY